jgi:hypothetical protein
VKLIAYEATQPDSAFHCLVSFAPLASARNAGMAKNTEILDDFNESIGKVLFANFLHERIPLDAVG